LSFHSQESSLHKVFTWFLLLIVCFCFFYGLCLLVFSFALNFWWTGFHSIFLFTGLFFLDDEFEQNKIKINITGLMIWWWMWNERLQLFHILDSFFYLTPQVWISWLFDPTSQNKCCFVLFLLLFCRIGLPNNNNKQWHGNFLQLCCSFVPLGWSLKPNYCWEIWFPEIVKKGLLLLFSIIMPTWFFTDIFTPKNNNYVSEYFLKHFNLVLTLELSYQV
jgi:hypothetical protein